MALEGYRSWLFFGLVVAAALFFAEGYSYDFQEGSLVRKSIIDLPFELPEAKVYLDSETSGVSLPTQLRVIPGFHTIEIRRDGFSPWKKTVFVSEEKVTFFPRILLFPQVLQEPTVLRRETKRSFSDPVYFFDTVFSWNPDLKIAKWYDPQGTFSLSDIPFPFQDFGSLGNGEFYFITPPEKRPRFVKLKGWEEHIRQDAVIRLQGNRASFIDSNLWKAIDLQTQEEHVLAAFPHPIVSVKRFGKTFHLLFLLKNKELLLCDEDGGNCSSFGILDMPHFLASQEIPSVLFHQSGNLVQVRL